MATFKYTASEGDFDKRTDTELDLDKSAAAGTTGADFPSDVATTSKTRDELFSNAFKWEPKYQHKFIMSIADAAGADFIPSYLIKSSAKPSAENGEITLDHINIQRKVKGKTKWNNIEITLYDPITPSGAQSIMSWFRRHHESATGRDGYSSYYKKNIKLTQLDGLGHSVEEWTIHGAFIQSCNWGSLDWSSEEIQTITATLAYDYAFMHY